MRPKSLFYCLLLVIICIILSGCSYFSDAKECRKVSEPYVREYFGDDVCFVQHKSSGWFQSLDTDEYYVRSNGVLFEVILRKDGDRWAVGRDEYYCRYIKMIADSYISKLFQEKIDHFQKVYAGFYPRMISLDDCPSLGTTPSLQQYQETCDAEFSACFHVTHVPQTEEEMQAEAELISDSLNILWNDSNVTWNTFYIWYEEGAYEWYIKYRRTDDCSTDCIFSSLKELKRKYERDMKKTSTPLLRSADLYRR